MPSYEHTLSLNALFAPEANGRGALGAGADAIEAIFSEVQTVGLFVLELNFDQRERVMRSDHCRDSRECTRHYSKTTLPACALTLTATTSRRWIL
jgi:hypothetical protein